MKRIATGASNEWNVPDWRDESQYPIPLPESDDSDLLQWRWEFLRRDKQYRNDWTRIAVMDPDGRLALRGDSSQCDFTKPIPLLVKEQLVDFDHFKRKYKLPRLLDPAVRKPSVLPFSGLYVERGVVVVINLDLSISRQLELAEPKLKEYQQMIAPELRRATIPDKAKWPLLLRLIDAKDEEKVLVSEIGYQLLGFDRDRRDRYTVETNVQSRLRIARSFWKKLPIPALLPPKSLTYQKPSSSK